MRLEKLLRIFCYLGLLVSFGMAPISMAQITVYMEEPFIQSPLNLALVPTARSQTSFLSNKTRPMIIPFIVETPQGPARARMLKFVAKGEVQHALAAQVVMATADATTQCVTLNYDQNGNRLSQTVSSMAPNPVTWGSGVYGCFVWAS